MISVRRSSPNCFLTSSSSFSITSRSFFSDAEDGFVFGESSRDFRQLVQDFVDREPRQAVQLQFQDGVGLHRRRIDSRRCAPRQHVLLAVDIDVDGLAAELGQQLLCASPRSPLPRIMRITSSMLSSASW